MDNNLETKNDYFAKKEEKEKTRMQQGRSKMMKSTLNWIIIAAVLFLIGWWVFDYFKNAAEQADKPLPGQFFEAQSRDHIATGAEHPEYNSNPPSGGWHYAQPAQTGIYDVEITDGQLIHNLEHGHVWIAHKPDLSADQIELLADIAKDYGSKIVMAPRSANDSNIALVAWQYVLKMDSVNEVAVREFIDAHRGLAGPERLPDSGFKDFRDSDQQMNSGPAMEQ